MIISILSSRLIPNINRDFICLLNGISIKIKGDKYNALTKPLLYFVISNNFDCITVYPICGYGDTKLNGWAWKIPLLTLLL